MWKILTRHLLLQEPQPTLPASPSTVGTGKPVNLALVKRQSAELLNSIGPAIPGEVVYPQEFTEITGPPRAGLTFIGCTHGPPEEPPDNPQLGNHQLSFPSVVIASAQYIRLGSSL